MKRNMTRVVVLMVFVLALAVPAMASAATYYTKTSTFGSTYLRLENGTYTAIRYIKFDPYWSTSSPAQRAYWKNVGYPSNWHIDYNYWVTSHNGLPCRVFDGPWYDI